MKHLVAVFPWFGSAEMDSIPSKPLAELRVFIGKTCQTVVDFETDRGKVAKFGD
jgi:hypothetical protein